MTRESLQLDGARGKTACHGAMTVTVSTFYKFVRIDDPAALQGAVRAEGAARALKGTVLIAREGINATVSGADAEAGAFLAWLRSDARFHDLVSKQSAAPAHPFKRFKVRLKREIVTLGAPEADPTERVGIYIKPEDWNALISADDIITIDTRNDYEVKIGTFDGAVDPKTKSFGAFKDFVAANLDPKRQKRVAMFCTGGIRCEKASAYMLANGFEEVFHLEGGILKYLETVPPDESLWRGECFVFDERVALEHGVTVGTHVMCPKCGSPVRRDDGAAHDDAGAQLCPACARG